MKNGKLSLLAVLLVFSIPLIYLASVYKSLPDIVATHFGIDGKPNGFGTKSEFAGIVLFMVLIPMGVYLLIKNIHKIDPKKSAKFSTDSMNKIAVAIVIFFTGLNILVVYSAIKGELAFNNLMLPFFGLFFAYLGNVMYSVKQNYFVGIRTPRTLESEDIWRKTHQLGGKLWFAGGLLIAIATLLLNNTASFTFLFLLSFLFQ
ncbi:MAG: SdpI family protein [Segetibacter sp.]